MKLGFGHRFLYVVFSRLVFLNSFWDFLAVQKLMGQLKRSAGWTLLWWSLGLPGVTNILLPAFVATKTCFSLFLCRAVSQFLNINQLVNDQNDQTSRPCRRPTWPARC